MARKEREEGEEERGGKRGGEAGKRGCARSSCSLHFFLSFSQAREPYRLDLPHKRWGSFSLSSARERLPPPPTPFGRLNASCRELDCFGGLLHLGILLRGCTSDSLLSSSREDRRGDLEPSSVSEELLPLRRSRRPRLAAAAPPIIPLRKAFPCDQKNDDGHAEPGRTVRRSGDGPY